MFFRSALRSEAFSAIRKFREKYTTLKTFIQEVTRLFNIVSANINQSKTFTLKPLFSLYYINGKIHNPFLGKGLTDYLLCVCVLLNITLYLNVLTFTKAK